MGKRDDILEATKNIIAEDGVMNATIGNILKKASTGYGTLYNYFDSKEDLYLTLYLDIINGIDVYVKRMALQIIGEGEDKSTDLSTMCTLDSKANLVFVLDHYIDYCLDNMSSFYALEALRYVPEICNAAKDYDVLQIDFFVMVDKCEKEGVLAKRDPFYNTNIMMGMIATFIRFYYQSDLQVTASKKKRHH